MSKKILPVIALAVIAVLIFGGIAVTRNMGKSDKVVSTESALSKLKKMNDDIDPRTANAVSSAVEYTDSENDGTELPEITDSSIVVKETTGTYAEIFSSPEKAGTGSDGWLREMAKQFNEEGVEVDGQKVSIRLRNLSSGLASDYIRTGKYVPDGYTPSNMMWIDMLNAKGIEMEVITERMVGNVPVIVMKNSVYEEFEKKYGASDLKAVVEATEAGEFVMGYTNPFTSSTGLNFLVSTLQRFDAENPLSEAAGEGFGRFQSNVPFVALTTVQMRDAAENGTLGGFILEYQLYQNDLTLKSNYTAFPFGYRHDNPLAAVGTAGDTQKEILKVFADYCASAEAQAKATEYGFNGLDDYKNEEAPVDGATLLAAQKFYKTAKDSAPVIGVFVADVSGSMDGAPINSLKSSLVNAIQYITPTNYIGLVSYSDDVTIRVPIGEFDLTQQSYFKGGVESLAAGGGTATYDAVVVGMQMIEEALQQHPEAKPILFVLSDGETNRGYSLNDVSSLVTSLGIPIYTINYNQGTDSLKALSELNEAATIDADSDDVVYQLKNLLNASI